MAEKSDEPTRREKVEELYDKTVDALLAKVKLGSECDAATLNVARAILKDAGVGDDGDLPSAPTAALAREMAAFDEEEFAKGPH